jgi:LAO/AO transport system kinase
MEIASIFVVNKSDRPGIEQLIAELESLVEISCISKDRKIPIVKTIAKENSGIDELIDEIEKHGQYLKKTRIFDAQRKKRYEAELVEIIRKRLMSFIFDESMFKEKVEKLIDRITKKELDPYTAADEILSKIIK